MVLIERLAYKRSLSPQQTMAVVLLMVGISVATVTDKQVASNPIGAVVAAAAVLSSSFYQVLAGAKQRELQVNGNQLVHAAMPCAVALLTVLVPLLEPIGLDKPGTPGTLLGYDFSWKAVLWILFTSVLGLVVTLSAFLFIGASSAITYNVVGHSRTVLIVAGGVLFFNDDIGMKKCMGIFCAVLGIVWYSVAPSVATPDAGLKQDSGVTPGLLQPATTKSDGNA